jgi:hypothetical protein
MHDTEVVGQLKLTPPLNGLKGRAYGGVHGAFIRE